MRTALSPEASLASIIAPYGTHPLGRPACPGRPSSAAHAGPVGGPATPATPRGALAGSGATVPMSALVGFGGNGSVTPASGKPATVSGGTPEPMGALAGFAGAPARCT